MCKYLKITFCKCNKWTFKSNSKVMKVDEKTELTNHHQGYILVTLETQIWDQDMNDLPSANSEILVWRHTHTHIHTSLI